MARIITVGTLGEMSAESPQALQDERLPVFHPDQDYHVGFSRIMLIDNIQDYARTINHVMRKTGRNERWRAIMLEDWVVAEGLWTLEEAIRFASGMTIGPDGNFHISETEYHEETTEDSGTFSSRTSPDAIKALLEWRILKRKSDSTYDFRLAPYGFKWVDTATVGMDITASVGEAEADGRIPFSLNFKEVKGKRWEIADRLLRLIPHLPGP